MLFHPTVVGTQLERWHAGAPFHPTVVKRLPCSLEALTRSLFHPAAVEPQPRIRQVFKQEVKSGITKKSPADCSTFRRGRNAAGQVWPARTRPAFKASTAAPALMMAGGAWLFSSQDGGITHKQTSSHSTMVKAEQEIIRRSSRQNVRNTEKGCAVDPRSHRKLRGSTAGNDCKSWSKKPRHGRIAFWRRPARRPKRPGQDV